MNTPIRIVMTAALSLIFVACQGHHDPAAQGESAHEGRGHHIHDHHSAHGKHGHKKPDSAPTTNPEDIKPNDGTRKIGDITTCPVTGDIFTINAETFSIQHDSKTYYLCCDGCEKKFLADPAHYLTKAPTSQPSTNPADVLPNDGTRKVGDITRCPVSGDVFTVSGDSTSAEHDGGTYYFCCGGCIDKFKANPERFTRP